MAMSEVYTVKQMATTTLRQREAIASFIEAGLKAIAEIGIDRVSVSQIAELAKSSRPTFYAYFGDISGLWAETWLAHGEEFLSKLSDRSYRLEVSSTEEKARMGALLEIFTVSHRIPEVQEIVLPVAAKWWASNKGSTEFSELKLAWLTANRLGSWLTQPIEPKAIMSSIVEPILNLVGDAPSGVPADPRFEILPEIKDPKSPDESLEGQLLDAAIRVIAKSGVSATSMTRIARNAQVSTGTIYPRYANGEEILLAAFEHAISQVVDENFGYIDKTGFAADQFGAVVIAGLQDSRTTWRNFRIETHLNGRIYVALALRMRAALEKTNERVATGLSALPISAGERESIAFLIHTIGIGMALLQNAEIGVAAIDHRVITREMIAAMARR
jgi:AcrR family transcriptional regulator